MSKLSYWKSESYASGFNFNGRCGQDKLDIAKIVDTSSIIKQSTKAMSGSVYALVRLALFERGPSSFSRPRFLEFALVTVAAVHIAPIISVTSRTALFQSSSLLDAEPHQARVNITRNNPFFPFFRLKGPAPP